MTAVLAFTAFIMALGAIWFTSEAVARVDTRNDAVLKPYLRKIHDSIDENHQTLLALKIRMEHLESEVRLIKLKTDLPPGVERETAAVNSGLKDLKRLSPNLRLTG